MVRRIFRFFVKVEGWVSHVASVLALCRPGRSSLCWLGACRTDSLCFRVWICCVLFSMWGAGSPCIAVRIGVGLVLDNFPRRTKCRRRRPFAFTILFLNNVSSNRFLVFCHEFFRCDLLWEARSGERTAVNECPPLAPGTGTDWHWWSTSCSASG